MVKQLAGNPRAVSMSAALLSKAEQKQEFSAVIVLLQSPECLPNSVIVVEI